MSLFFKCPNCDKNLKIPDELAGKRVKCPGCSQVVNVPPMGHVTAEAAAPNEARSDAPCAGCGKTFVLQPRWPSRGGLCSRCGGHYCFECINAAFRKTIKDHPAQAEQFLVADLDVADAAALAQKEVGDHVVLATVGKDGAMPCPKCFGTTWKRELFQPKTLGAYSPADHHGVFELANRVQALINSQPGDHKQKLKASSEPARALWKSWRALKSSGLELSGADLSGLQLNNANLSHCDLRGADLSETKSYSIDLQDADLSHADLHGCLWSMTFLSAKTLFRHANLTGGSMTVSLQGDWTGANLTNANLQLLGIDKNVCLKDVNFTGCKVSCFDSSVQDALAQFQALLTPEQQEQLRVDADSEPPKGCVLGCVAVMVLALCTVPIGLIVYLARSDADAERARRVQVTVWIEQLTGNNSEKRNEAVRELVKLGPQAKSAVKELASAVSLDKRPEVRLAAVRVLGAIGPDASGAEGALQSARQDADPALRAAAEAALEKIRPRKSTPTN